MKLGSDGWAGRMIEAHDLRNVGIPVFNGDAHIRAQALAPRGPYGRALRRGLSRRRPQCAQICWPTVSVRWHCRGQAH